MAFELKTQEQQITFVHLCMAAPLIAIIVVIDVLIVFPHAGTPTEWFSKPSSDYKRAIHCEFVCVGLIILMFIASAIYTRVIKNKAT